jgi:crossover junction endodeoxyribonuclease RusA
MLTLTAEEYAKRQASSKLTLTPKQFIERKRDYMTAREERHVWGKSYDRAAALLAGKPMPLPDAGDPDYGKVSILARLDAQKSEYPEKRGLDARKAAFDTVVANSAPGARKTRPGASLPVELVLPWPPTGNSYVRHTLKGKHYLTDTAKAFRRDVAHEAMARGIRNLPGSLVLSVEAHAPDKRRRDLDNLFKCLLDALEKAGVVENDYQFSVLTIKRMPQIPGGVLHCRIYSAGNPA